jgi:hypothetical protein
MLDNLRNESSFQPDEPEPMEIIQPEHPKPPKRRRSFDQMTGTNARQRFMLALMLLVMVCLLGVILLVFTGKVAIPIQF